MAQTILSLDPSSTCTGYAVIRDDGHVIEGGKLTGKRSADAVARVLAMRLDLLGLLREFQPSVILVEMPTGKQYTRTPGKRSGMTVWAGAAWAIWMVAVDWSEALEAAGECLVHPVSNVEWTRGKSKDARKEAVALRWSDYKRASDTGGDISDSVAMAWWWQEHRHDLHIG